MPYIKPHDRMKYEPAICAILVGLTRGDTHFRAGELNYVVYSILVRLCREIGLRYEVARDLMGELDCCKDEFYRRIVAPYEDKKVQENGDVT